MGTNEISLKEADAIARRAQVALTQGQSVAGADLAILRSALDTWSQIVAELTDGSMSMRRLREILGILAQAAPTQPDTGSANPPEAETKSSGTDPTASKEKDAAQSNKNANHPGRRSAKDHPEASREVHEHPTLHSGSPCSQAGCTGRVYGFKRDGDFRTFLRITGGAPLRAEVHEFHDLRCNLCGEVYAVPPPPSILADGPADQMYGYSAIATVALYKYLGGTPWYRQAKLQDRLGLDVSPSTQWDLCEALADAGRPIYAYLPSLAANYPLFFADDCGFTILAEKDGMTKVRRTTGKEVHRDGCHTSCIIAENDERHVALFKTGIIHAGEWMDELLRHRQSGLSPPMHMADRSTSNNVTVCPVLSLACNAHLRNRFDEIKKHFRLACGKMLDLYKKIYKVDAATKNMDPLARLAHLRGHAGPLMDEIFRTAKSELDNRYTEPNSQLGRVYQYAINHENELRGFLKYTGAPLDDNCCESMLARVVMLRKNVWFYKNQVGAWVSDVIMTLGQSAILAGENPYDYYLAILRHQAEVRACPDDFLPWTFRSTVDRRSQRTVAAS